MMWDWEISESAVRVLEGHRGAERRMAVDSVGGRVFSCAKDGNMRSWGMSTGTETEELFQGIAVSCVAVCAENRMIVVGLGDGTLRVLDCETKEVLFEDIEAHGISCVSFSPNGSYVATGSYDKTIRVWNTRTWARVGGSFEGHEHFVTSVAFSPDGKQIVSSSLDCSFRLWGVDSGACVGISKTASWILSVSFTGDGDRIVSASGGGSVRIWDAHLETETKKKVHGHSCYTAVNLGK